MANKDDHVSELERFSLCVQGKNISEKAYLVSYILLIPLT